MNLLTSAARKLGLNQVNNYAFNIGADPKKLVIHGTTAAAVDLITFPIFTGLTTLAGGVCGSALQAMISNPQAVGADLSLKVGALFGSGLGAIVGIVGAKLISMNIAQSILSSSKTPSITNEEALSLAKIRLAEQALAVTVVGGLGGLATRHFH